MVDRFPIIKTAAATAAAFITVTVALGSAIGQAQTVSTDHHMLVAQAQDVAAHG